MIKIKRTNIVSRTNNNSQSDLQKEDINLESLPSLPMLRHPVM